MVTEICAIVMDRFGKDSLDWKRRDMRSWMAKKIALKLIYDNTGYSYRAIGRMLGTSHVNVRHHLELFESDMVFISGLSEEYYKLRFKLNKKV